MYYEGGNTILDTAGIVGMVTIIDYGTVLGTSVTGMITIVVIYGIVTYETVDGTTVIGTITGDVGN